MSKHTVAPKIQNTFIIQQALKKHLPAVELKFLHFAITPTLWRGSRVFLGESQSSITVTEQETAYLAAAPMPSLFHPFSSSGSTPFFSLIVLSAQTRDPGDSAAGVQCLSIQPSSILVEPHTHRTHTN